MALRGLAPPCPVGQTLLDRIRGLPAQHAAVTGSPKSAPGYRHPLPAKDEPARIPGRLRKRVQRQPSHARVSRNAEETAEVLRATQRLDGLRLNNALDKIGTSVVT